MVFSFKHEGEGNLGFSFEVHDLDLIKVAKTMLLMQNLAF